MTSGHETSPAALGFLTVLAHDELGLAGGYLILNRAGRPLEFHCTAPVKPNRAQQILFGPTLEPYLYGEQIGQTLVAKGSCRPEVVCTNVERVLAVRDFVALPVVLVLGPEGKPESLDGGAPRHEILPERSLWRVDVPHPQHEHLARFSLGRNRLALGAGRDADREAILGLEGLADFDLSEPFGRIQEAIEEAHRQTRAA
jgi:hypothetical protein